MKTDEEEAAIRDAAVDMPLRLPQGKVDGPLVRRRSGEYPIPLDRARQPAKKDDIFPGFVPPAVAKFS